MVLRIRVTGVPPAARAEGEAYFCALCVGARRQMGRVQCGAEVPGGSRAATNLMVYPMEAERVEACTASMNVIPTFKKHVCCFLGHRLTMDESCYKVLRNVGITYTKRYPTSTGMLFTP